MELCIGSNMREYRCQQLISFCALERIYGRSCHLQWPCVMEQFVEFLDICN